MLLLTWVAFYIRTTLRSHHASNGRLQLRLKTMEYCKDSYIKSPRSKTVAAAYKWYETRDCDWSCRGGGCLRGWVVEYGISAVVALITGNPRLVRMRPFNLVLLVSFCVVLKEPRGLSTEGNLRFKIDWARLIAGRRFTVFALFYFVFEGNF